MVPNVFSLLHARYRYPVHVGDGVYCFLIFKLPSYVEFGVNSKIVHTVPGILQPVLRVRIRDLGSGTFLTLGFGIRNPEWKKIRIRDKHPGSVTLMAFSEVNNDIRIVKIIVADP
jgi:hypothetical protein